MFNNYKSNQSYQLNCVTLLRLSFREHRMEWEGIYDGMEKGGMEKICLMLR